MKLHPIITEFKEGLGFSREDWDAVDYPEWTDEELKNAKTLSEMPEWLQTAVNDAVSRKRGERGKQKKPTKVYTNIGLDRDVLEKFKATGAGWQARMNEVLKASAI